MEVEHVPYIFGSFTRRRQSQHMGSSSPNTPASPQPNSSQNSSSNTASIRLRPAYQHAKSKSQPEESSYHPAQPTNLPTPNSRTLKTRSCLVQQPPTTPRRSGIIPGVIGLNSVSPQKSIPTHMFNTNTTASAANSSVTDCFSGVSFGVNASAINSGVRNTVNETTKDVQYEKNCKTVNGTKVQSEPSFGNGKINAICLLCGKIYLEPRVLSCLHTFCTRCLQELVEARRNEEEMWLPVGVHSNTSGSEASLLSSTSGSTTPTNNDKDSLEGSIIDSNSLPRPKTINRHSNTSVSSNNNRINHNRSNSSPLSTSSNHNGIHSTNSNKSSHGTNSFSTSKFSNRDSNLSNTSDSGGCIICPVCNFRTALNRHGVFGLSPDYVVQHRLVLSTLNDENTRLLCDLCTGETTASHRCSDCLINLCPMCTELHHRHNNHNHELLTIKEVRQRGLMRIHRRIMCLVHPELELTSYCSQCTQVVCSDCVRLYHNDHNCEPASRAAVARAGRVQRALQKVQTLARREQIYADQLKAAKIKVEDRCHKVEEQIEQWIEEYKRAIEEHRKELFDQVNRIREDQLSFIISQQHQLECRLQDAETSITFTETLLNEGSDIELLTFIATILKRLEKYDNIASSAITSLKQNKHMLQILRDTEIKNEKNCKLDDDDETEKMQIDVNDDVVKFLSQEKIIYPEYFRVPLYGIVTDQYVCPKMSEIRSDGLESAKINNICEFIIICRDEDGNQLKYGGEKLYIQIKYVNNSLPKIKEADPNIDKLNEDPAFNMNNEHNVLPIQVEDKHDGTFSVKFIPNDLGTFLVNVRVHGQHIQDSPLTLHFQNSPSSSCKIIRPHRGVYHCCTWCSSGGKKITDALNDNLMDDKNLLFNGNCGCGGTMPGGYQGCGHGHVGHPGKKHWSCCGNTQETGSTCTFRFTQNRGRTQNRAVMDKNICNYNKEGAKCSMRNNERIVKGQTTKVYHITL